MSVEVAVTPDQLKELGEWSRKIIEVYMQWYTFFVTSNLLVMSWFHSKENTDGGRTLAPLARLFQALNVIGTVSTAMVGYYVSRQTPDYRDLIVWSAIANGGALLGIAYVWHFFIPEKESPASDTSQPLQGA